MEVEKQGERKAGYTNFGQLYSAEEKAAGMALCMCVCVCVCVCMHGKSQRGKVVGQR